MSDHPAGLLSAAPAPKLHMTRLDIDEATTVYVNRLKRHACRIRAIGEEILSLLDVVKGYYVFEDEDSQGPDTLASIEDLGSELHDLAMIAHTTDFKDLHHILHP